MFESTTVNWHTFLSDALRPGAIIIDAGANYGAFSSRLWQEFGIRSFAIEPQPDAADHLRRQDCSIVYEIALSDKDGSALLRISENSEAATLITTVGPVPPITVRTATLSSFMEEAAIQTIDLLKLDIEGTEIAVLQNLPDERLNQIKQITVEYHDFLFQEHREEIAKIDELLKSKGFIKVKFSLRTNLDVLYINSRYFALSRLNLVYLRVTRALHALFAKVKQFRNHPPFEFFSANGSH